MRFYAQECPDRLIGQQIADQLPWFHIVSLVNMTGGGERMSTEMSSKKSLCKNHISAHIVTNKTCQGYARIAYPQTGGFLFFIRAMMQRPFTKPATTFAQQVAILQQRGMAIADSSSAEFYLQHLNMDSYSEPLPPVWAVCEVMSLGLLSRWYNTLKPMPTRRAIASVYGVDEGVLQSWLHHLSLVRNVCAHHSRLWNRDFSITPKDPRSKPRHLHGEFITGSRKLYNSLVILLHFMDIIAPQHHWRTRLKDLIALHAAPVKAMDFPHDWRERPIWQVQP